MRVTHGVAPAGVVSPTLAQVLASGNDGGAALIKNIADPVAAQDAATRAYTLAQIAAAIAALPASPILYVRRVLTHAEIIAWPTTAIQILAAPGAGFMYDGVLATWTSKVAAGGYGNVNAAAMFGLQCNTNQYLVWPSVQATVTSIANFLAANTVHSRGKISPNSGPTGGWSVSPALANLENRAVEATFNNAGGGNLTGGNVANTVILEFYYTRSAV